MTAISDKGISPGRASGNAPAYALYTYMPMDPPVPQRSSWSSLDVASMMYSHHACSRPRCGWKKTRNTLWHLKRITITKGLSFLGNQCQNCHPIGAPLAHPDPRTRITVWSVGLHDTLTQRTNVCQTQKIPANVMVLFLNVHRDRVKILRRCCGDCKHQSMPATFMQLGTAQQCHCTLDVQISLAQRRSITRRGWAGRIAGARGAAGPPQHWGACPGPL